MAKKRKPDAPLDSAPPLTAYIMVDRTDRQQPKMMFAFMDRNEEKLRRTGIASRLDEIDHVICECEIRVKAGPPDALPI